MNTSTFILKVPEYVYEDALCLITGFYFFLILLDTELNIVVPPVHMEFLVLQLLLQRYYYQFLYTNCQVDLTCVYHSARCSIIFQH